MISNNRILIIALLVASQAFPDRGHGPGNNGGGFDRKGMLHLSDLSIEVSRVQDNQSYYAKIPEYHEWLRKIARLDPRLAYNVWLDLNAVSLFVTEESIDPRGAREERAAGAPLDEIAIRRYGNLLILSEPAFRRSIHKGQTLVHEALHPLITEPAAGPEHQFMVEQAVREIVKATKSGDSNTLARELKALKLKYRDENPFFQTQLSDLRIVMGGLGGFKYRCTRAGMFVGSAQDFSVNQELLSGLFSSMVNSPRDPHYEVYKSVGLPEAAKEMERIYQMRFKELQKTTRFLESFDPAYSECKRGFGGSVFYREYSSDFLPESFRNKSAGRLRGAKQSFVDKINWREKTAKMKRSERNKFLKSWCNDFDPSALKKLLIETREELRTAASDVEKITDEIKASSDPARQMLMELFYSWYGRPSDILNDLAELEVEIDESSKVCSTFKNGKSIEAIGAKLVAGKILVNDMTAAKSPWQDYNEEYSNDSGSCTLVLKRPSYLGSTTVYMLLTSRNKSVIAYLPMNLSSWTERKVGREYYWKGMTPNYANVEVTLRIRKDGTLEGLKAHEWVKSLDETVRCSGLKLRTKTKP